jgi:hypothetical protein
MSPFNAKSLLEYWPTIKYQNIYIYITDLHQGFFGGEFNSPFGNQKEKRPKVSIFREGEKRG